MADHRVRENERTLLITENVPYELIYQEILSRPNSVVAALVRGRFVDAWRAGAPHVTVLSDSLFYNSTSLLAKRAVLHGRYLEVYNEIISDVRSLFIAERTWPSTPLNVGGAFQNATRIAELCWYAISLLDETRPTRIVCASTPHVTADWLVARTAELLNIPVHVVGKSPIPWRCWALSGLDEQRPVETPLGTNGSTTLPTSPVQDYVALTAGDNYSEVAQMMGDPASAGVQRPRSQPVKTGYLYLTKLGPHRLAKKYLRDFYVRRKSNTLRRTYDDFVQPIPQDTPFIALFLHYQPERTTFPEGLGFANQLAAVYTLSAALPQGWRLVVREHPATFEGPAKYQPNFRSPDIYRTISSIPDVSLVSLAETPFSIVDKAMLVATATGSVGFQSICRGTPVLALGAAPYRDAPGVYALPADAAEQSEVLARCFKEVQDGSAQPSRDQLLAYLAEVEALTVGEFGETDDGSDILEPTLRGRTATLSQLVP